MNEILSLGYIENLPGSLRHLNLAHNRLTRYFEPIDDDLSYFSCNAPILSNQNKEELNYNEQSTSINYTINRHSSNFK